MYSGATANTEASSRSILRRIEYFRGQQINGVVPLTYSYFVKPLWLVGPKLDKYWTQLRFFLQISLPKSRLLNMHKHVFPYIFSALYEYLEENRWRESVQKTWKRATKCGCPFNFRSFSLVKVTGFFSLLFCYYLCALKPHLHVM